MIRINRELGELQIIAKHHLHELKVKPFNVEGKLDELIDATIDDGNNEGLDVFIDFLLLIKKNFSIIIIGEPFELQRFIDDNHYLFTEFKARNDVSSIFWINELKKVFSYQQFSARTFKWGAYELVQKLDVKVCPYCNRNFINTFLNKEKRTRARLDHWYDKESYPYLALSFFNLIPSCHTCNSDFKNTMAFKLSSHLHPYVEGIEDELIFRTKIKSIDFLNGDRSSFSLMLEPANGYFNTDDLIERARTTCKLFGISELYDFHKDLAGDIILKSIIYNDEKLEELMNYTDNNGDSIFSNKTEALQLVLGNFLNKKDFEKRPFSKLTRDIAMEQGLLTLIKEE